MTYKLKKINKTMMYQIAADMGVDMGAKRADCEFKKEYRHNGAWLQSSNYKLHLDTYMGAAYLYVRSWDGSEDFVLKLDFDYLQDHGYLVEIPDAPEPETAVDSEPEPESESEPEPESKSESEPDTELDTDQEEESNSPLDLELYNAYADVSVLGGLVDIPFPSSCWTLDKNHYTLLGYLLNERGPDASPVAYLKCYDEQLAYIRSYTDTPAELFLDAHMRDFYDRLNAMTGDWVPVSEEHMQFEIDLLRLWEQLHDKPAHIN